MGKFMFECAVSCLTYLMALIIMPEDTLLNPSPTMDSAIVRKQSSELNDSSKVLKRNIRDINFKCSKISKEIKKTDKLINQFLEDDSYKESLQLLKKRSVLEIRIHNNDSLLSRNDLVTATLKDSLAKLESDMVFLNSNRDSVFNQFYNYYRADLDSSLSVLSLDKLNYIENFCKSYSDQNKFMAAIMQQARSLIDIKKSYDRAVTVLNSKFNKKNVEDIIERLFQLLVLQGNCNEMQRNEMKELKEQLSLFEPGLEAFKQFINNLNKYRDGTLYSVEFYYQDLEYIIPAALKNSIENKLFKVPYLKHKYDTFFKDFYDDPNRHTSIESEILGQ